jgi:hypothetical protein
MMARLWIKIFTFKRSCPGARRGADRAVPDYGIAIGIPHGLVPRRLLL